MDGPQGGSAVTGQCADAKSDTGSNFPLALAAKGLDMAFSVVHEIMR